MNDKAAKNPGYMLFFRGEDWDKGLAPEELQTVMDRFIAWSDGLVKAGKVRAGEALGREGAVVRQAGRVIVDGPFTETKEAIGGYCVLLADSLEEALAIAKTSPFLQYGGSVEVRPVLEECPTFKRIRERLAEFAAAKANPSPALVAA